ncbi:MULTISPECIES: hypothetical protein [unclassified Rhizobium]|uniref:hypothetical protein n=1 Tax=unclassified Rhizobium TaxID=2613769 RepID=UPI000714E399|nr:MULTISPECIES: hypothetical protein [unclassified Rhizobium]KQS90881.1 hypothetical protein ASG42_10260 [Rhizobium sp. Leaf391]KQS95969.1 hypothetical protein ASG50_02480 [Rhizobium sp. Leaf386]KQU09956.1 hypothetical protein ASG68_02890 [Rhizobium sp. Leaf453]
MTEPHFQCWKRIKEPVLAEVAENMIGGSMRLRFVADREIAAAVSRGPSSMETEQTDIDPPASINAQIIFPSGLFE